MALWVTRRVSHKDELRDAGDDDEIGTRLATCARSLSPALFILPLGRWPADAAHLTGTLPTP
jgi:hypothetical protein